PEPSASTPDAPNRSARLRSSRQPALPTAGSVGASICRIRVDDPPAVAGALARADANLGPLPRSLAKPSDDGRQLVTVLDALQFAVMGRAEHREPVEFYEAA